MALEPVRVLGSVGVSGIGCCGLGFGVWSLGLEVRSASFLVLGFGSWDFGIFVVFFEGWCVGFGVSFGFMVWEGPSSIILAAVPRASRSPMFFCHGLPCYPPHDHPPGNILP